jgi:hypothetical protein
MESYINNNVNDITYQSELIPPAFLRKQEGGINSPKQLTFILFRKLWAH